MSDLSIALVAEGKTDQIVISSALKAIVPRPFVLTLLQPETSDPLGGAGVLGGGWGGVYRWCRQLVSMQYSVGANPSLAAFDLVLLHVDADVAGMSYSDAKIDDGRTDLPCERPCPPAEDSVNALREAALGWIDLTPAVGLPERWVFCNPSKCTEAWVIAALYGATGNDILKGLECNLALEEWLCRRPKTEGKIIKRKNQKTRKITSAYRNIANRVTNNWGLVQDLCPQSIRFTHDIQGRLERPNI
jgi:hypothetical protein